MLALVGSGEYLPAMEAVDRFLLRRLRETPRVACLPTAAGTESAERIAYWNELGVRHFQRLGAEVQAVPVTNREEANDPALLAPLMSANFVYLSGGKPDYLYNTLLGSLAWQYITRIHESGGVLAGCSAGAMVMGGLIPGFPRGHAAFNLLPGVVVIPHFDEIPAWMVGGIRLWLGRSLTLVGIEGYTALVYDGEGCQVQGSGSVIVWNRQSRRRYASGEKVPF